MADHQHIDFALLEDLRHGLQQLGHEFSSVGDIPDHYDVGSGDVQGALSDFGAKWDSKRKELQGGITNAHGFVDTSITEYDKLEQDLVNALQGEGGGGGG